MRKFWNLTMRNVKLYFTDKEMFFTSLITPVILLVLYATFLANVFENSFLNMIPEGVEISKNIVDGFISGELISSLLAVSCITVAFCSNLLMVQDKVSGAKKDLSITPTNKKIISMSYFFASFISTVIINIATLVLCLIYVSFKGWFMSVGDVMLMVVNIILLTLFGCALSSVINTPLKTQGQMSAVGTIVSAGYGFICGAYMPISSFSVGLQKVLSFLPSTYATALIRNVSMNGVFSELAKALPLNAIEKIKEVIDCKISFFGNTVSIPSMYLILIGTILILLLINIFQNKIKESK